MDSQKGPEVYYGDVGGGDSNEEYSSLNDFHLVELRAILEVEGFDCL
jgi:hypothetical protein